MEHMRVATLLGRSEVRGIFDTQAHSMDVAADTYSKLNEQPLIRYESVQAACDDDSVDAIFICTPNHTHRAVLEQVVTSGKPIFLEKSFISID